jgi:AraC family transcriptional regulator, transcriptional activator of pobA
MQHPQNNTLIKFRTIADGHSFDIHTIQWLKENGEYENDIAQRNNHFQIIWITKGNGDFWIDLKKCGFQNNQLFFIKPCQVYCFQSADELEGYVISFTDSFLGIENQESDSTYNGSLFQMFTNTNGIQISNELVSEMKDFAEKMIKEYNNLHLFRDEMLRRYLKILFIYLSRHFEGILQTIKQTRNIELVQKFMSLLDKNFKTEKMVSGYASLLLVTPNYLNEIIKKTTGYSAGYHIRQRIVLEAKRQATYSDTCMKQIGYYLGFNDMAHFSKFFKSATGMNFTDFKKEKMVISMAS